MKLCKQCGNIKPLTSFGKSPVSLDGYRGECKQCGVVNASQNRDKIKRLWDACELTIPESKLCPSCGETKSASEFAVTKYNISGLYPYCKECNRDRHRANRQKNMEKVMLSVVKGRAKRDGIPFDLELDDIIIPEHCPVLGIKIERTNSAFKDSSPSVDKIVPSKGYVKGNIVIVSNRANLIKRDATIDELVKIAKFYTNLKL